MRTSCHTDGSLDLVMTVTEDLHHKTTSSLFCTFHAPGHVTLFIFLTCKKEKKRNLRLPCLLLRLLTAIIILLYAHDEMCVLKRG